MECHAFTLGFSNRSWEATLEVLKEYDIRRVVDIRTLPGSKHTPQFNLEHMAAELPRIGVHYVHLKALGGLRKPQKDSVANAAWRNDSFRGYADYMQTSAFEEALDRLIELINERKTAFACTEAVFWRCHRQLVSDALLVRGISACHIFDSHKRELHKLTSFAQVIGRQVTYPPLQQELSG